MKLLTLSKFCGVLPVLTLLMTGCDNSGLDKNIWKFSGSDIKRGIDHYYSKPSVKKVGEGVFTVTTRGVPKNDGKAVEKATNVKNAHDFDVKMEVGCKDKYVRVISKDYRDRDGISLLVEKEEMKMDAVREITEDMPIYRMYQELCR